MPLSLRWVGSSEADPIIQTRLHSFAPAPSAQERYTDALTCHHRAADGDYLLAQRDGRPIGTTTSLSLTMYVRGTPLPCQGVAWVGAIRTERRKQTGSVATQLMNATLARARERGQTISALMPFRASFYERFGYGLVEQRSDWTIPLRLLPTGPTDGFRPFEPIDQDALIACRQRTVQRGQCDILQPPAYFDSFLARLTDDWLIVDRPDPSAPMRGYLIFRQDPSNQNLIRVAEQAFDDFPAFLRQLHFLSSLRDQYSTATLITPIDLPLFRLFNETQLPHRTVPHPCAELRIHTRMQLRILDHKRFLESIPWPGDLRGSLTLAIHEHEQSRSTLRLEIESGKATVNRVESDADVEIPAPIWPAIATGDLKATKAAELGLVQSSNPDKLQLLNVLSEGPLPFCRDYF